MLVLISAVLSFSVQAQGMKERTADKKFDVLAYASAGEMYAELAKKSDATDHQIRRAAECNRLTGNSVDAEKWYAKLSTHSGVKAEDFYHYAQMLKMNEKYDLANKMMARFGSMNTSNSIAKAHSDNANYVAELKSTPNKYDIAIFGVNTKASDFGPNYYTVDGESSVVFASARTANTTLLNNKFQWDGSNFLDAYRAQVGGDGEDFWNINPIKIGDLKYRITEESGYDNNAIKENEFLINTDSDTIIRCSGGTVIKINKNTFGLKGKSLEKEIIVFRVREILSKSEMILENLST